MVLKMLAEMGAPINPEPVFPPPSKFPRPFARFRAVAAAVRATFRFRYICRRKREYLQVKSDRLHPILPLQPRELQKSHHEVAPSISLPRVTFSAPVMSDSGATLSQSAASAGIHLTTRIPTATSGIGIKPVVQSHSRTKIASTSQSTSPPTKKQLPSTSDKKAAATKTKLSPKNSQRHVPMSHSRSKISKVSPTRKGDQRKSGWGSGGVMAHVQEGLASEFLSSALPQGAGDYDPQLLEYMEGLERYRTRLSKTRS